MAEPLLKRMLKPISLPPCISRDTLTFNIEEAFKTLLLNSRTDLKINEWRDGSRVISQGGNLYLSEHKQTSFLYCTHLSIPKSTLCLLWFGGGPARLNITFLLHYKNLCSLWFAKKPNVWTYVTSIYLDYILAANRIFPPPIPRLVLHCHKTDKIALK